MKLPAPALAIPLALASFTLPALAQQLVVNPTLVRGLPPPGWLADRRAEWVEQRPVYQSTCQTPDVAKEIIFLNRIVGRDENFLFLAANPPSDDSALAHQAQLAEYEMGMLRDDIAAVDELVSQFRALPPCSPEVEATETAAPPATIPVASAGTAPAQAPAPATSETIAAAPSATAPQTSPATPPPAATPETNTATSPPAAAPAAAQATPDTAQTVTLRFDDKVFALTPLSVRAFNKASDAIHDGKNVHLAIEGCDASADFSKESLCAKRLASVKRLLADQDIIHWKRVLGDHP